MLNWVLCWHLWFQHPDVISLSATSPEKDGKKDSKLPEKQQQLPTGSATTTVTLPKVLTPPPGAVDSRDLLKGDNLVSIQSTQNSAVQSEAKAAPAPQPIQQPATNTGAKAAPPSTEPTQASSLQSEVKAPPPVRQSEAAPPGQPVPPKPTGVGAVKPMEYPCLKNGDANHAAANIEMK